ncbi:uncharacterized protein GGS22DRAFT_170813 [Annulohypoxylon maeteangense]|uniref:uncharacterized protein n=1 Tax=Annulohypoxylon maeteangense TaxID=1927788 RepID=UPI002007D57C|nr:uncharacterized protein GGS22DRAFT_170813 [Annulohypoxylon maeteangense]KAI0882384.1 hypothetical protein GGS22DRAFT_170813 [Annulohypoxylon maeteangense]
MPFQDLMSRLKSIRKPQDQKSEPCEDESPDYLNPSQQTKTLQQYTSDQPSVSQPKPVKGLRKASVSARLPTNREKSKWTIDQDQDQEDQDGEQNPDPEPSDYLYFGEGISATSISQSLENKMQNKPANSISGQPSIGIRNNPIPSNGGKDNSGFIETGLNIHTAQMGYSNLTYGGSLQFDYAGTHS